MEKSSIEAQLKKFDKFLENKWKDFFSWSEIVSLLASLSGFDKRLYALYLIQVYHWSSFSARSLGLAGANLNNKDTRLMMHYFEHANEETGHELMALHDLKKLGLDKTMVEEKMPEPLPETAALIAYVQYLATGLEPYRMLGYDYWTEKPYDFIGGSVRKVQKAFGLEDSQMTFYLNHEEIDKKHGDDISRILKVVCDTEEKWEQITKIAEVTMKMTFDMVKAIIEEYKLLKKGKSDKFIFLNSLN